MKITLIILLAISLLLLGCSSVSISDIKDNPNEYVGDEVTLRGETSNRIALGKLSGFTLTDKDGVQIPISSESLPEDGSKVTVKGVVKKELFLYIQAEQVN